MLDRKSQLGEPLGRIDGHVRDRDRRGLALDAQMAARLPGVLADGAIEARPVDDHGSRGQRPVGKTEEAAVSGRLVFQHEMQHEVARRTDDAAERQFGNRKGGNNTGLVIPRAAAVDARFLHRAAERWARPPAGRARIGHVEMGVDRQRRSSATRNHGDEARPAGDVAQRFLRAGKARQPPRVVRHAPDGAAADRLETPRHRVDHRVLALECARDLDQRR